MTIQMKAIEQYFHVVLFIMLYKVVLTFKFVDKTLVYVTIQMKAYFHLVLFIVLYKVVLTFKFVGKTLVYLTIQMKAIEQLFHVVLGLLCNHA